VQLNPPLALVVREPLVQLVIGTLSKMSDLSAVRTENPDPVTVTVEPGNPFLGETLIDGVVTLKLRVACPPPTSVAVTVVPDVPLGTVKVQLKEPVALVPRPPPRLQLTITMPSKTRPTVVETENPVPVTVTVAPTGPFVGATVIFGVVTLNVPVADLPPTSVAVTVVPDVPLGTLNVQLNVPVALVASEPLVQAETTTPSNTSPTVVSTEKPVPETVTVAPVGPCFGATVIFGVVTLNVPVAV